MTQVRPEVSASKLLIDRDWNAVTNRYRDSQPYNYAVLDNFLQKDVIDSVRAQLLTQWGWQYKNWQAQELYVRDPGIPEIPVIAEQLKSSLPDLLGDYEFVRCWAFMHQRNAGLAVHADNGAVTLDLWITPDEYNLDRTTGGLVFFDVKRAPDMMIHEFNTVEWAERYFAEETRGCSEKVGYRFNRAVLFDAGTFHQSDIVRFIATGADTYRINLSLLFDDPEEFARRRAAYDAPDLDTVN
ncbi:MAG: hypothetical protein ACRDRH_23810 [Pseudonocardia sp.]